jgi:hypothetical protein
VGRYARHSGSVLRRLRQGRRPTSISVPFRRTCAPAFSHLRITGRWQVRRPRCSTTQINGKSYRQGRIGEVGNVDTYMSQNAPTFTVGPLGGTPLVNGATQNTTYDLTGANTQSLITDGWTAAAAARVVKLVTCSPWPACSMSTRSPRQPSVPEAVRCGKANGSSDGSGNLTLTIAPQIITSGAFQNCRRLRPTMPR